MENKSCENCSQESKNREDGKKICEICKDKDLFQPPTPTEMIDYKITPTGQMLRDIVCSNCNKRFDVCRLSIAEFEACSEVEAHRKKCNLSGNLYDIISVTNTPTEIIEVEKSGIISQNGVDISDHDLLLIHEDGGDEGNFWLLAQVRYIHKEKSWQVYGEHNYRMNLVEIDNDEIIVVDRRFAESIFANQPALQDYINKECLKRVEIDEDMVANIADNYCSCSAELADKITNARPIKLKQKGK